MQPHTDLDDMSSLKTSAVEKTANEVNAWGYSFPLQLVDKHYVAELIDLLGGDDSGRRPMTSLQKRNPHLLFQPFWDVAAHPNVLAVVNHILGPNAVCFATSVIDKPADKTSHVAWHQDATYWGLGGRRAITIWLALTPSTAENGAVRVVPGRHDKLLDHETCRIAANMLGLNEALSVSPDESRSVTMTLRPGEASVHDSLTVHGSERNRSASDRVGFSMRFVSSADPETGAALEGLICSPGIGVNNTLAAHAPAPDNQTPEQAKACHQESLRRLGKHLMQSKQTYHLTRTAKSTW
jgi:hypothetical protein